MAEEKVFYATGRRKTSAARVFMKAGSGKLTINGKKSDDYLLGASAKTDVVLPLKTTNCVGKFDINVTVKGGGVTGQAGAIRLGVARCLVAFDEKLRDSLKSSGYLKRDSRMVERKKYGLRGARRATQFSKR